MWELTPFHDLRGWLVELFRIDELPPAFQVAMSYLSMTKPGVTRGPHEHEYQADYFCFLGPSDFELYLWDNRKGAVSFRSLEVHRVGVSRPMAILVPPGVVHAYKNVGESDGWVFNAPDQLYAGKHREGPIDEIRWETETSSPFRVE